MKNSKNILKSLWKFIIKIQMKGQVIPVSNEQYLELIEELDLHINNEIEELDKLDALAEKVTQENDGMPHASGTSDKVGNIAVKIVMKQHDINEIIDLLIDLRDEIIVQIKKLPIDEYDVLYKYYVVGMSLFDIADKRNKSDTWVKEKKKSGIRHIKINESDTYRKVLKILFQSDRK